MPARPAGIYRFPCPCQNCKGQNKLVAISTLIRHVNQYMGGARIELPCPCGCNEPHLANTIKTHLGRLPPEQDNIAPPNNMVRINLPPRPIPVEQQELIPEQQASEDEDPTEASIWWANLVGYCQDIIRNVGKSQLSQAGATLVMQSTKRLVSRFLQETYADSLPTDFRQLERIVAMQRPKCFYRAVCPKDHKMFDADDDEDIYCPKCDADCRFNATLMPQLIPNREVLYYDLDDFIRRMMSLPEFKADLLKPIEVPDDSETDVLYSDFNQGSIYKEIFKKEAIWRQQNIEAPEHTILICSMCTDATEVFKNGNQSYCPITCHFLSFSPHRRKLFATTYFAGCCPPGMKDMQLALRPVLEMFARRQPGDNGEDLVIQGTDRSVVCRVRVALAWMVNDIRGISAPICAKQAPAYHGACIQCQLLAVRTGKERGDTSYYPGACHCLPENDEGRKRYREEFKKFPERKDMHDQEPPGEDDEKPCSRIRSTLRSCKKHQGEEG